MYYFTGIVTRFKISYHWTRFNQNTPLFIQITLFHEVIDNKSPMFILTEFVNLVLCFQNNQVLSSEQSQVTPLICIILIVHYMAYLYLISYS